MGGIDWKYLFLSYEGRINRQLWWIGNGVMFGISVVATILFGEGHLLTIIIGLLLIYPSLCLHIKRCHDRDKSGWWCLLLLIPLVGLIWAIVDLGILEGTPGSNEYGPDPLEGRRQDASL